MVAKSRLLRWLEAVLPTGPTACAGHPNHRNATCFQAQAPVYGSGAPDERQIPAREKAEDAFLDLKLDRGGVRSLPRIGPDLDDTDCSHEACRVTLGRGGWE